MVAGEPNKSLRLAVNECQSYTTLGLEEQKQDKNYINVYKAFVCMAFGGLLYGYSVGVNSNIITTGELLCGYESENMAGTLKSKGFDQCYILSSWGQGFLTSVNLVGATLSSLMCFKLSDYLGRRLEVQIGAFFYAIGSVISATSPTLTGIATGMLLFGFGIGFVMHAAPVYISEVSPPEVRGRLIASKEAIIVLGMFLGFLSGCVFGIIEIYGWRFTFAISFAFSIIMFVCTLFIPRSASWLIFKAQKADADVSVLYLKEAEDSLRFFHQDSSAEEFTSTFNLLRQEVILAAERKAGVFEAFSYPLPLIVGCGLVFLQQVSGQPAILYYATNIFKAAGFGTGIRPALCSMSVGLVKVIATLFTAWRVDEYGRRYLLFLGIGIMVVSLAVLSVSLSQRYCTQDGVDLQNCPADFIRLKSSFWGATTIVALMCYVSGYQVGFGPISWLMISEVFPLNVRGAAMSVAVVVNFSSNIGMTYCQESLFNFLTVSGTMAAYCLIAVLSFWFVKVLVPETRGKTLEQIDSMLLSDHHRKK